MNISHGLTPPHRIRVRAMLTVKELKSELTDPNLPTDVLG